MDCYFDAALSLFGAVLLIRFVAHSRNLIMANNLEPEPKEFHFIPEYANQIAHGGNHWAYLEYYINSSIWALANVAPALGACMTSQIFTLHARLNALLALLKFRKADAELITKVNKFAEQVRDAQEARNRMAHDLWLLDTFNPGTMGKMRVTAEKALRFHIKSFPLEELKADVEKINVRRLEFGEIRREIERALPTLPEIPHRELHPIDESHSPPQNPASEKK
jgi:hypothetical protein